MANSILISVLVCTFVCVCMWDTSITACYVDQPPVNCTSKQCVADCCDGWIKDGEGRCIFANCQCQHGGTCQLGLNQEPFCRCPFGTKGRRCETVTCTLDCHRSNNCTYKGSKNQHGCQFVMHQNPRCPSTVNPCDKRNLASQCGQDSDCPKDDLCCYQGCKMTCQQPADKTCFYQGRYYSPGEKVKASCESCMCLESRSVSCHKLNCLEIPPVASLSCDQNKDQCCPKCDGGPKFESCPDGGVLRVPLTYLDRVYLPRAVGLRVTDSSNTSLNVQYRPHTIHHCRCPLSQRDYYPILAYAHDRFGRPAQCHFSVLVEDTEPPTFKSCPKDINASPDESVSWEKPEADDNVGVQFIDGREPGGRKFPIGSTRIIYRAWDFDRNEAICQFTIRVFEKADIAPSNLHYQRTSSVIAGTVGGVFILLIIFLIGFFVFRWRRRRPMLEQSASVSQRVPINQAIYQNSGVKLPKYSPPPVSPPAYDDIMSQSVYRDGDEQPPMYEDAVRHVNLVTANNPLYPGLDTVAPLKLEPLPV